MFSWGVPGFLESVPRFLGKFRAFLGVFLVFLGVFWVFLGCSGFSWECFGFFGSVPVFSVVPECSVMFSVPVFLEVLHAEFCCLFIWKFRLGRPG